MPSKREHTKSRLGCRQCKQRRIKCDEKAPCCGPCTKKGLECEYKELAGVQQSIQILTQANFASATQPPASRSGGKRATTLDPAGADEPDGGFSSDDLFLMHHYTLETARTLGALDEEGYRNFWQTHTPDLAYRFPFLMHAVLSVTAAHRARLDVARHHYGKAIAAFNASGHPRTEEHADAIFCYCILIMIITWALECTMCPNGDDPVLGALDLFGVTRTAVSMLAALQPDLLDRDITRHMRHLQSEPATGPVPADVAHAIDRLDGMVSEHQQSYAPEELEALHDACQRLRWFYTFVLPRPQVCTYLLRWPLALSPLYLALLQRNDLAALAIFAHWCVPIHHAPSPWFVGDWPRQAVLGVARRLTGTVWQQTIDWPLTEVSSDLLA